MTISSVLLRGYGNGTIVGSTGGVLLRGFESGDTPLFVPPLPPPFMPRVIPPASARIVSGGFPIYTEAADPKDYKDWSADFSALLETGETISYVEIALPTGVETIGLKVDLLGDGTHPIALINSGTRIVFWVRIEGVAQQDPEYHGAGILIPFSCTITTSSGRRIEKTVGIQFKQQ